MIKTANFLHEKKFAPKARAKPYKYNNTKESNLNLQIFIIREKRLRPCSTKKT